MDGGYDAQDVAASSHSRSRQYDEEGRGHRSHRERDHDRSDRDRRHHRDERGERDDRRDRDRDGRGERDYRGHDRERDGGYGRDRGERDDRGGGGYRDDRRRRREDDYDAYAEPMGGGAPPPRRMRYEEESFAQPMRGDYPPPRRDDYGGGDYRGGGGGGRGGGDRDRDRGGPQRGRGEGRGGGGRRDSPPRSPTPPGSVPLESRHIEKSLWDLRPPMFEGLGAMEAKMTGMFSYGPGRVPPPAHLGIPPALIAGSFAPGNIVNSVRQAKRIYIGNISDSLTAEMLKKHFTRLMRDNQLDAGDLKGEIVQEVGVDEEKRFAFIEFRTPDEASAAMRFDGETIDGNQITVKPPKDYIGIDPALGVTSGGVGMAVAESPNKLFIGGLPTYLNEDQVMELLKSFGELKSFNLVKDGVASKGFAFAEYIDTATTDMAISGLHNFQLGDRTLVVQRAEMGRNTGVSGMGMVAHAILAQAQNADGPTSRVMLLLNMVTADELYDNQDYEDILEDINDECGKYGEIEGVRVPRPVPKDKSWSANDSAAQTEARAKKVDEHNGVGRVYVMFKDTISAGKAMKALGGRQFAGRTILTASVPESEFMAEPEDPAPPPEIENGDANGGGDDVKPEVKQEPAAPPPPPPPAVPTKEELDKQAADALQDIMGGIL